MFSFSLGDLALMIPGKANGKPAAAVAILFTNDRRETDIVKSLPEFPNGFDSRIAVEQGFQIWLSCTVPDLRPQGRRVQVFGPDDSGDAQSDAFSGVDLELVAVIQAWAELPESVKTAVMEMVRSGG